MAINSFYLKAYSKKKKSKFQISSIILGKNHLLNYIYLFKSLIFLFKIFFNIIR